MKSTYLNFYLIKNYGIQKNIHFIVQDIFNEKSVFKNNRIKYVNKNNVLLESIVNNTFHDNTFEMFNFIEKTSCIDIVEIDERITSDLDYRRHIYPDYIFKSKYKTIQHTLEGKNIFCILETESDVIENVPNMLASLKGRRTLLSTNGTDIIEHGLGIRANIKLAIDTIHSNDLLDYLNAGIFDELNANDLLILKKLIINDIDHQRIIGLTSGIENLLITHLPYEKNSMILYDYLHSMDTMVDVRKVLKYLADKNVIRNDYIVKKINDYI